MLKIAHLYKDHADKFMDVTMANLMSRRYGAGSFYDMTLDELSDMVNLLEDRIRKVRLMK